MSAEFPHRAPAWYCVRTQPKHEHIAAAHLAGQAGTDVYLPRIRFKKATRGGPVWFTEALFPNYVFSRFDLATAFRRIQHTRGVAGIVHFGLHWPEVPQVVISDLQATLGSEEIHQVPDELQPGDTVLISGGALDCLQAVVTRVMPAQQRVAILLDFLGRQTTVEIAGAALVRSGDVRRVLETGTTGGQGRPDSPL